MDPISRPNYFSGEALLKEDFVSEQAYHKAMLESLNQGVFLYGVAGGLDVEWDSKNKPKQVTVKAGMAIDGKGQQIVLTDQQPVSLSNLSPGKQNFLTIRYHEELDEQNADAGVSGYKRIVQRPQFGCGESFTEGIDILLAVIDVSGIGDINAITHRYGSNERCYAGALLGQAQFVAQGCGVKDTAQLQPVAPQGGMSIRAHQQIGTQAPFLRIEAPRTDFSGPVTMSGHVGIGIGIDSPQAALQVRARAIAGLGTLTSDSQDARKATLSEDMQPFFAVGDVVIVRPANLRAMPQQATITAIDEANRQITVDSEFNPPLHAHVYTWVRALASFDLEDGTGLLEVRADGQVGLGRTGAHAKDDARGPYALVVSPDRKVGIALASGTPPQSELHVNGDVRATKFIGDGSQLTGVPEKANVWTQNQNTKKLYYGEGNVGIFETNPLAPLSVGGGLSTIGTGLVSFVEDGKLSGYLTNFTKEVRAGDTIAVGMLVEQTAVVDAIIDDTHLTVTEQFPIGLVGSSRYSFRPKASGTTTQGSGTLASNGTTIKGTGTSFKSTLSAGDVLVIDHFVAGGNIDDPSTIASVEDDTHLTLSHPFGADVAEVEFKHARGSDSPQKGDGKLSSSGTAVTGVGTQFTKLNLKAGDKLIVERFVASAGALQGWYVKSVESDTSLTLVKPSSSQAQSFGARVSAFVVTSSLLALVRANDEYSLLQYTRDGSKQPLPPAFLIAANGHAAPAPNTLAINIEPQFVDNAYALQVNGAVSFGGAGHITQCSVDTLEVSQSVTIAGDSSKAQLLSVSESGGNPLLTVTQTNVQIGTTSGTLAALDVGGELNCTSLVAQQLSVAGVNVATDGSVQCFGKRVYYTHGNFSNEGTELDSGGAVKTDGFLIATVGTGGNPCPETFLAVLEGFTKEGNTQAPSVYATAAPSKAPVPSAPKDAQSSLFLPVPGTLTMPVRKGETWSLKLHVAPHVTPAPSVDVMWTPLGTVQP